MTWKVEGDYFEGCNCDSICPCIFFNDPDKGDCRLTIAWHIERGHYESTQLDGLNVVGVFHAPGNMAQGPKWKAAIYLDQRASPQQAEALGKIFSGQAGGFLANVAALIGEVVGERRVPIDFAVKGRRRTLKIPGTLELDIEGTGGADSGRDSLVTNPALYGAAGFDPVIAHSTKNVYKDHGMEWDNTGKNAFYSRFAYAP